MGARVQREPGHLCIVSVWCPRAGTSAVNAAEGEERFWLASVDRTARLRASGCGQTRSVLSWQPSQLTADRIARMADRRLRQNATLRDVANIIASLIDIVLCAVEEAC
jgi:hypothetical protein